MGIFIFLHVQIDKLGTFHSVFIHIRIIHRLLVKSRHTFHQLRKTFSIVQCMRLGIDTRNFNGNIIDVRSFQCFQIMMITMVSFSVTQYDLPQQVYVLPDFLSETSGKMFRQLRTGLIKNHLRGIGTETFLYNGNSYKIKMISKCLIHFKKEGVTLIKKLRYTVTVYQLLNALSQFLTVTNLGRLIQHLHQKLLVLRTLHHNSIFMLLFTFFICDGLFTCVIQPQYPFLYFSDSRSVVHNILML